MASTSRLVVLSVLAIVFAVPCLAKTSPVLLEVPGYAKYVLGSYGEQGLLATSWFTKRNFYAFRSLRFASNPVGERRFLPPVPDNYPYPDDEIYNAVEYSPGCPQGDFVNENCLLVSVYTPYLPGNASDPNTIYDKNLPVAYWIYGGSFDSGQTIIYEPHTFMETDVVIVQVQYRLGALGFLSLDTDEIPGNAGMFDQIEGLRWVQKFIKFFGGDPNQVTIFGESAGGASVGFLLLAPQAKGLFHNAIAQSGSMLADWALDRNAGPHGYMIAEEAGCPLEPYADLLHCLRTVDWSVLRAAQRKVAREDLQKGKSLGFIGQSPVIQYAGAERALTAEPKALMEAGDYNTDVNIMFGANKHEGLYVIDYMYGGYVRPNGLENDYDFFKYDMIPLLLDVLGVVDNSDVLADLLTEKYLGYVLDADQMGNFTYMIPGIIDMGGALFLKAGGWETVRIHSKHRPGKAWWYSFDMRSRFQLIGSGEPMFPPGVNHADEIQYLWTVPVHSPFNETERTMTYKMLTTWTNMMKFGDPTPDGAPACEKCGGIPKFLPYTENKSFMAINSEWECRDDYTRFYTVTVDDLGLNSSSGPRTSEKMAEYKRERDEYRRRVRRFPRKYARSPSAHP